MCTDSKYMAIKTMTKPTYGPNSITTNSTIGGSLKEFFGVLSKKEGDEIEAAIVDGRARQRELQKQRSKKLEMQPNFSRIKGLKIQTY